MVVSLLLGSLYSILDSVFISMVSEEAMTAISLVYPIQNLGHVVGAGFGVGINAQIARMMGAGRTREAEQSASQGLFLGAVHAVVIMAAGCAVIGGYIRLDTDNETVFAWGLQYFHVVFAFSLIDNLGMTMEKIYQSAGRMMVAMVCYLSGCAVDLVLDPLLIFGIGPFPEMGIRGAALATGIGQTVTLLCYFIVYKKLGRCVRIRLSDMRPRWEVCRPMYYVGIPSVLNLSVTSVMLSGLNAILAPFSPVYILVLGVCFKFRTLLYQTCSGLMLALRPLAGYNCGAGERERVRSLFRTALAVVAAIMLAGTLVCELIPGTLVGLYVDSPEALRAGVTALRIISCGFIVSSVSVVSCGMLEGLGKGPSSLAVTLLRYVVIILGCALLLSRFLGAVGVWHAFWVAELATAVVAWVICRRAMNGV